MLINNKVLQHAVKEFMCEKYHKIIIIVIIIIIDTFFFFFTSQFIQFFRDINIYVLPSQIR